MTGPTSKTEDTQGKPVINALFPDECARCGNFGLTFTTSSTYENPVCGDCMVDFIVATKAELKNHVEK